MREVSLWSFLGFYGVVYILLLAFLMIGWSNREAIGPVAALIFPLAASDDPWWKMPLVASLMYWGMVLFYTIVIQKIRLKP